MQTQHLLQVMPPVRVAAALNIKVQAVYQWGATVPPLRQYQLREYLGKHEPETLARLDAAARPVVKRRLKRPAQQA